MGLFDKIISLLTTNNIEYRLLEHEPVYTSEQAATIRGLTIKQGAKAMLCIADNNPLLIVLSGADLIDTKKVKQHLSIKDLRFASPDEVERIATVKVGAVAPFGSLMGIQTYCDEKLLENIEISFNPGIHTRSITMPSKEYVRVERPVLINCTRG